MKVRVTGVIVKQDQILLLRQRADARQFSLPGGTQEEGETLAEALIREMREETGLGVEVDRLLYLCDHLPDSKTYVVHVTFEVAGPAGLPVMSSLVPTTPRSLVLSRRPDYAYM